MTELSSPALLSLTDSPSSGGRIGEGVGASAPDEGQSTSTNSLTCW